MNSKLPVIIATIFLAATSGFSQSENAADRKLALIANSSEDVWRVNEIIGSPGWDRIDADTLRLLLKNRRNDLLGGSPRGFYVVMTYCEMVSKNPEGSELVPDLLGAIDGLDAPTAKFSELKDWEQMTIRVHGDKVGVLMGCVLNLKEVEGFKLMYERFQSRGETRKLAILLERVVGRQDYLAYLEQLGKLSKQQPDSKVRDLIEATIRRIREHNKLPPE